MKEENIKIINGDIDVINNINSFEDDINVTVINIIKDKLLTLGFDDSHATLIAIESSIEIDFDIDDQEELSMVSLYIENIISYLYKKSLAISGGNIESNSYTIFQVMKKLVKENKIELI